MFSRRLDRQSPEFKAVYKQRTADERAARICRSNSQAKELDIERPYLRRGSAIANQNTLIYILINLRTWHRIQRRRVEGTLPAAEEAASDLTTADRLHPSERMY